MSRLTGVKVFSATKSNERNDLGSVVTHWLKENPDIEVIDKVVTQSSDREYHCLSITIFFMDKRIENKRSV